MQTRRYNRSGLTLAMCLAMAGAYSQPLETPAAPPLDVELQVPDQVVEVSDATDDTDIGRRIRGILESTDRFRGLEVRVENGVVFIAGEARKEDYREWARQLALRTKDVVAVVNNVTVAEESMWNFEPAWAEIRALNRQLILSLPLVLLALLILLLTAVAGRLIRAMLRPLLRRRVESAILREVLSKATVVLIAILGLYFFLRISGLTSLALAILSGTGMIGLLIGFAFRDIAENFLASILISIQKPFGVGDTIEVDGHTGIVQKVTTRGTVLMAFDGNYIQIANSTVYKSTIRNFTANPKTRMEYLVRVSYGAGIARAQSTIMEVLRAHQAVLDDPEPNVLVESLGASSINLRIYYWINVHEHNGLKVNSAIIRQSLAAMTAAGIAVPDEAREIIFPQGIPVINFGNDEQVEKHGVLEEQTVERAQRDKEAASTESEGDLESDVAKLNAQARASHPPEEGQDLLASSVRGGAVQPPLR